MADPRRTLLRTPVRFRFMACRPKGLDSPQMRRIQPARKVTLSRLVVPAPLLVLPGSPFVVFSDSPSFVFPDSDRGPTVFGRRNRPKHKPSSRHSRQATTSVLPTRRAGLRSGTHGGRAAERGRTQTTTTTGVLASRRAGLRSGTHGGRAPERGPHTNLHHAIPVRGSLPCARNDIM